ncbi:MAG: glycosyltransferase family 39 protein [Candidatus Hydrogenedentes bacterium]|nr:glycosyltransferase family 39 protein [Candidatus Hydrogenedentota bacterium]
MSTSDKKQREENEAGATPIPFQRGVIAMQLLLIVFFSLLFFLSVLAAPLYKSALGGFIGANALPIHTGMLIVLAAQFVWISSRGKGRSSADCWSYFAIFALFLIGVCAFISVARGLNHWGILIGHDEPQYFSYLHSWVFDHDLSFENEYREIPNTWKSMQEDHPERPDYNVAPIGSAVIWLPFYLTALVFLHLVNALGVAVPLNGMSSPYAMAAAFGSHVAAAIGMALIYATLRKWFSVRASLITILFLWTSTPLIWYLTDQPWMSHAPDFFAVALVLWFWLRFRERWTLWTWIGFGATIGLASLVRPNHITLIIIPISEVIVASSGARAKTAIGVLLCAGAMLLTFLPQIITHAVREDWAHKGIHFPPGSPMEWAHPAITEVLFSAHHGLFAWHPVLLFGFIGVLTLWPRSRYIAVVCAVILALSVYMNAAIQAWWAGGSFGMRRFAGDMPFMAPGFAAFGVWFVGFCRKRPFIPAAFVVVLTFLYNVTLQKQMREGYTDSLLPVTFQRIWSHSATLLHDMIGNPFSFPANAWFAFKHDTPLSQYDYVAGVPPRPDMYVEGLDQKPFLGKGWLMSMQIAAQNDGGFVATEKVCTLLFQLKWGHSYRIKLAMVPPSRLEKDQGVAFAVNGVSLGAAVLKQHTRSELTLTVPESAVRQGLNTLSLTFDNVLETPRAGVRGGPQGGRGFPMETSQPLRNAGSLLTFGIETADAPPSPAQSPQPQ